MSIHINDVRKIINQYVLSNKLKFIRCCIVAMIFLSVMRMFGWVNQRAAQEIYFQLSVMGIIALLIDNIWVTLFLLLTIFNFVFFKFQIGQNYVSTVFLGSLLYYATKQVFQQKHIDFFIKGLLWFCVINCVFIFLQLIKFDFFEFSFYTEKSVIDYAKGLIPMEELVTYTNTTGLMGFKALMGVVMALCVPLFASRQNKLSKVCAILLFIPLYLSEATVCIIAGIIGLLFVLIFQSFKYKKTILSIIIAILLIGGTFYALKIDNPKSSIEARLYQWKLVLNDSLVRPFTGWGLDSFRHITKEKKQIYVTNARLEGKELQVSKWDNPHNLIVSLMFEWGGIAIFLLIGFLRQYVLWFKNAIKTPVAVGLAGFILVTFIVSMAQFPMWLARSAVLIIPVFALFEIEVRPKEEIA